MDSEFDQHKAIYVATTKASLRATQRTRTWEQRVQAIARMNAAGKIAKAGMLKSAKSRGTPK